jgi:hypothetical protein
MTDLGRRKVVVLCGVGVHVVKAARLGGAATHGSDSIPMHMGHGTVRVLGSNTLF